MPIEMDLSPGNLEKAAGAALSAGVLVLFGADPGAVIRPDLPPGLLPRTAPAPSRCSPWIRRGDVFTTQQTTDARAPRPAKKLRKDAAAKDSKVRRVLSFYKRPATRAQIQNKVRQGCVRNSLLRLMEAGEVRELRHGGKRGAYRYELKAVA